MLVDTATMQQSKRGNIDFLIFSLLGFNCVNESYNVGVLSNVPPQKGIQD